jgi:hypothetical protein
MGREGARRLLEIADLSLREDNLAFRFYRART